MPLVFDTSPWGERYGRWYLSAFKAGKRADNTASNNTHTSNTSKNNIGHRSKNLHDPAFV